MKNLEFLLENQLNTVDSIINMFIFFQNNNIHSSPTPWIKQPGSASTAESPILAPRRRLESVESAAKFLTEALPNNNMTGYCKNKIF